MCKLEYVSIIILSAIVFLIMMAILSAAELVVMEWLDYKEGMSNA